jgi:hypothetical protein
VNCQLSRGAHRRSPWTADGTTPQVIRPEILPLVVGPQASERKG